MLYLTKNALKVFLEVCALSLKKKKKKIVGAGSQLMVKVLSGCSLILQVQLAVSPKAELILNIFVPTNAVQAEGTWEGSTQECAFVLMPLCCRAVEGAGENKKKHCKLLYQGQESLTSCKLKTVGE